MSLYPAVPVYLALGLAMAVMAMAVGYMLSDTAAKATTSISTAAWVVVFMALAFAYIHLFTELLDMMNTHFAEGRSEEGTALIFHLVNISLAISGAFLLKFGALSAHFDAQFGARFR